MRYPPWGLIWLIVPAFSVVVVASLAWQVVNQVGEPDPVLFQRFQHATMVSAVAVWLPTLVVLGFQSFRAEARSTRRSELLTRDPEVTLFDGFAKIGFGVTLLDENRVPDGFRTKDINSMTLAASPLGLEFWSRRADPFLVARLGWSEVAGVSVQYLPQPGILFEAVAIHRKSRADLLFYPASRPHSAFSLNIPGRGAAKEIVTALETLAPPGRVAFPTLDIVNPASP